MGQGDVCEVWWVTDTADRITPTNVSREFYLESRAWLGYSVRVSSVGSRDSGDD